MEYELLLECYRKKLNLTYKSICVDPKNDSRICTVKTYHRLVNGDFVRGRQAIISNLFKRIDRPIAEEFDVDYTVLSKLMEYGIIESILDEVDKLLTILEPYKENALYDFRYQGVKVIDDYYRNKKHPEEQEVNDFFCMEECMEVELFSLLIVIFGYKFNIDGFSSEFDINKIRYYEPKHLIVQINSFIFALNLYNNACAFSLSADIEERIKEDNVIAKVGYYPHIIELCKKMGKNYQDYYYELYKLLIEEDSVVPQFKKNSALANLAINEIVSKEYEKALDLLDQMKNVAQSRMVQVEIYSIFCSLHLGKKIDENYLNLDITMIPNKINILLYTYFKNYELDAKDKNKVLLTIIRDHLTRSDYLYMFIIEEEIKKNCKEMGGYKNFYEFHELKGKNL